MSISSRHYLKQVKFEENDKVFTESIKSAEFLVIQVRNNSGSSAFIVVAENGRIYIDPEVKSNVLFIKSSAETAIEKDNLDQFKILYVKHQIKIKSPNDLYGYVEIPIILFCIEKGANKCFGFFLCVENVDLCQKISTNFGRADGMTMAATTGNIEIMKLMEEKGRKIDEAEIKGAAKFCQNRILEWILEKGNINEGSIPYEAIESNNCEGIRMLLEKGAGINAKGRYDDTPLHEAVRNNSLEMVRLLVEKGADVKAKNICGDTPLHTAAWFDSVKKGELLIAKGADINAKDKHGKTPLHLAKKWRSSEIQQFLLSKWKK